MADPAVARPLDPSERYFWLLDRLHPMNVVVMAELARRLGEPALRRAVDQVQQRHRLLRVCIAARGDALVFVDTTAEIPIEIEGPGTPWASVYARELDRPFDTDNAPCVRCVVVPAADGSSVLFVAAHHAVADGLGGLRIAQEVLRAVAGIVPPAGHDDPPGVHDRFPAALTAPRAVVDVASAVRAERAGQPPPADLALHVRRGAPRRSRVDRVVLSPGTLGSLRERARAAGTTVHGAVAAATLGALAAASGVAGEQVLCLATPTDLRRRVEPPLGADAVMLATGMLCTPYRVGAGDEALARAITEQTRREVERGESHLFYRFAHAGRFTPTDEGVASFRSAFAAAPQNIAVSNMGVVDDTDDPPWVRTIGAALGTSSNQPLFLTTVTYRDRLVLLMTSDDERLRPGAADAVTAAIRDRLAGHGHPEPAG